MDKVYMIIVNYKTERFIEYALKSIKEQQVDLNILIVDNGSNNESYKKLVVYENNNVEILRSYENLGFAGGNNFGFDYLKSKYDDVNFLFLLNPDAMSTPNLIYNLLSILKTNEKYAAVSPHIIDSNTKEDWFAGTMIDYDHCRVNNKPILSKDPISVIDIFNGCAVLFDAKKFEVAGCFDESIFMYYDEAFLSKEFENKGYKSIYASSIFAFHEVSASSGSYSYLKSYYMTRNHLYFFNKFAKNNNFICSHRLPLWNLISSIKNQKFEAFRGTFLGLYHYHLNKKGRL